MTVAPSLHPPEENLVKQNAHGTLYTEGGQLKWQDLLGNTITLSQASGSGALPADTVIAQATRIISNIITAGDTQPAWRVLGSGRMEWGQGGSSAPDVVFQRAGAGTLQVSQSTTPTRLYWIGNVAAGIAQQMRISGDAQDRFSVLFGGTMQWGDGTAAQDTTLARIAAGYLALGSSSQRGRLIGYGSLVSDTVFITRVTTDAQDRFTIGGDGRMLWGDGAAAPDTLLQRGGVNTLFLGTGSQVGKLRVYGGTTSDQALQLLVTTDTQLRFFVQANGRMGWGPGNATQDVTLQRTAANRLLTDALFDATTLALATKVKAGAPTDADWAAAPPDGTMVADSTANKLWVRVGGVWKGVAIA